MSHPKERPSLSRRDFLRRAAVTGVALPSMAAILAACSKGAQQGVASGGSSASSGSNQYGTGGIGGAPYPLARLDAPVTWTIQTNNQPIASGMQPESGATLQVLRWPYYLDDGVVKAFEKKYNCKVQITEFDDMDKGLAKINSGQGAFDVMFGMNVWAVGRSIAAGLLRPYNHSYMTNFSANVWDSFKSPFYDVGANFTIPYSVWSTGIFWRNDKLSIDPATMSNPYDVFWTGAPKGKTHLLANAQDVLALAMFHDGMTDVNVTDPAAISKAKDEIAQIATAVGGLQFDHVDYTDVPAGKAYLHQSWSGNVSDAVVFLSDKSKAANLSYYWPGHDGHPANVDNDTTVLLTSGKNPVLAHLLADFLMDPKNSLANFTNTTGYQMPVTAMTPDSMTSSGVVPSHLSSVIVTEEDFKKGSRELELPPDADALWQQAFAQLLAGV
jgi:spermidine/putrescine transport system substrate-binding protein